MIIEPGIELLMDDEEVLVRMKQYHIFNDAMKAFSESSIDHKIAAIAAREENKGEMQLFISQLHTKFPSQLDLVITQLFENFPNDKDNGYTMYIIEDFKTNMPRTEKYIKDIYGDDYDITEIKHVDNTHKDLFVNPRVCN